VCIFLLYYRVNNSRILLQCEQRSKCTVFILDLDLHEISFFLLADSCGTRSDSLSSRGLAELRLLFMRCGLQRVGCNECDYGLKFR